MGAKYIWANREKNEGNERSEKVEGEEEQQKSGNVLLG